MWITMTPQSFAELLAAHDAACCELHRVLTSPESTQEQIDAVVARVNAVKKERWEAREG
jgi:hypothetical protein